MNTYYIPVSWVLNKTWNETKKKKKMKFTFSKEDKCQVNNYNENEW